MGRLSDISPEVMREIIPPLEYSGGYLDIDEPIHPVCLAYGRGWADEEDLKRVPFAEMIDE